MRLMRDATLPKAVRALFLGAFLATAAVGITACGEDDNDMEEAAEEVEDAAEEVTD